MEEKQFSASTFQGELELLIRFAMRAFYYKVSLPRPIFADNLFPDLIEILVNLIDKKIDANEASQKVNAIKDKSSSFPDFQKSLEIISAKIVNSPNPPKFTWELTSDFVHFFHEFLLYAQSSLAIIQKSDTSINGHLTKTEHYLEILHQNKPEKARDSKPISMNLSDPKIGAAFNQFVTAQSTSLPRCGICRDPATYFTFPCSHPVYCDVDYEDCGGAFDETCPICHQPVTKLVRVAPEAE